MKKTIFAAMVVLATAFASCETIETDSRSFDELDLTFDVADPVSDTGPSRAPGKRGMRFSLYFMKRWKMVSRPN